MEPTAAIAATAASGADVLEQKIARVASRKDDWAKTPIATRLVLLHACIDGVLASATRWVQGGCAMKGIDPASALEAIRAAEHGVVVLLNCEESADEMFAQFDALAMPQEQRTPSRSARMDLRTYGIGAQILKDLGVRRMTLLASPRKMPSMTGFNLEVLGFKACPGN